MGMPQPGKSEKLYLLDCGDQHHHVTTSLIPEANKFHRPKEIRARNY